MRTAYQYRLRLTTEQQSTIDEWLELCRRQYNYRLAERFNWWEQNRCDVNACPLICDLPSRPDRRSRLRGNSSGSSRSTSVIVRDVYFTDCPSGQSSEVINSIYPPTATLNSLQ